MRNQNIARLPTFNLRLAHEFRISEDQNFTLSGGTYSQILPYWTAFYKDENNHSPNQNLPYIQAVQIGGGYNVNKGIEPFYLRTRIEGYYHNYWNMPMADTGTYSPLNDLYTYPTRRLGRVGWAENYGIEITAEPIGFRKSQSLFVHNWYSLFSISMHRSSYTPDTISQLSYRTRFDNLFSLSAFIGSQWTLSKQRTYPILEVNGRFFLSKSFRFTPADTVLSKEYNSYMPNESLTNYKTMGSYYPRIDFHVGLRFGGGGKKGNTVLLSLDYQNFPFVTGNQGFLGIIKSPTVNTYWDRHTQQQIVSNHAYQFRLTNSLVLISVLYFFNGKTRV